MVKASDIRKLDKRALEEQLVTLKEELSTLRVQKVTGGAASRLVRMKGVRRSIARCLTVANERRRAEVRAEYKGKKYLPTDIREKKTRAIRRRLTKFEASRVTTKQHKKNVHFPKRKFAVVA